MFNPPPSRRIVMVKTSQESRLRCVLSLLVALFALSFGGDRALAAQFAYVANRGTDDVTVIDMDHHSIVATVPVVHKPEDIAVHPRGTEVYVPNEDHLTIINAQFNTTQDLRLDYPQAMSVAVKPDGSEVYVCHKHSQYLSVFDTASRRLSQIALPIDGAVHIAVSPLSDYLYVVNTAGDIFQVDLASHGWTLLFDEAMPDPRGLAVDTFNSVYVSSYRNANVKVFSVNHVSGNAGPLLTLMSGSLPGRIRIDIPPAGFGGIAMVVKPSDDEIARIFSSPISLPNHEPMDVASSRVDRTLVIANENDVTGLAPDGNGSISILPPSGSQINLPGGRHPHAVAVGPYVEFQTRYLIQKSTLSKYGFKMLQAQEKPYTTRWGGY
jgi:YVTN family beta-propeller protein